MRPTRDDLKGLRAQSSLDSDQVASVFSEIDALTTAHRNIMIYANDAYIKDSAPSASFNLGKSLLMARAAVNGKEITVEKVPTTP